MTMLPCVDHITVPKQGNGHDQNEDAFALFGPIAVAPTLVLKVATLSDGTSVGQFSRMWSKMLARACRDVLVNLHCQLEPPLDDKEYIDRCVSEALAHAKCRWQTWATKYQQYQSRIPWYSHHGLMTGAFATLLGVAFHWNPVGQRGNWAAVAVGDTCLFQMRGGELVKAFPIQDSKSFDSYPDLLGSCTGVSRHLGHAKIYRGTIQANDKFYLMTDALAEWFLSRVSNLPDEQTNQEAADCFFGIDGQEYVSSLRRFGALKDDDTTAIRITF